MREREVSDVQGGAEPRPGASSTSEAKAGESLPSDVVGQLLGLLAHDLRNPLSALHSNLSYVLAQDGGMSDDVQDALRDSLVSSDSLRHMISNLDLFSNELQQLNLTISDENSAQLGPVLQFALRRAQAAAQSHAVSLRALTDLSEIRDWVRGSPELLEPLFDNLIHNSIQYSRSRNEVTISVVRGEGEVVVEIHDPGPVISEGFELEAFTALGQVAAKSRRAARYSRAFGLYCAALSARRCGARISSRPGPVGNLFEVRLDQVDAGAGSAAGW